MKEIITIRKQLNMSQKEFAEHFHLSVRTLQRWEQNQTQIPEHVKYLINEVYSMQLACLKRIPEKFRVVFWDTNFEQLDIEKNKEFIISRMYCKGGIPGIMWVERTYSYHDIKQAAMNRRDLNPIVANHLKNKFGLRKSDMKYYTMSKDWRKNEYETLDGVKVSFLHYPYEMCKGFVKDKEMKNLMMASVEDIAAMKLSAIGSRGAKKDFFDLYEILNRFDKFGVYELIQCAKKKFGEQADLSYMIMGMDYFEDAESEILPKAFVKYDWDEIKKFFIYEKQEMIKIAEKL